MKKIFIIFSLLICFCGCQYFTNSPISEMPETLYENYDVNSLKSTDITYQLSEIDEIHVLVDGDKKLIRFTEDWYIVHKDWIKTFNENQDIIINSAIQKKTMN